MTEQSKHTFPCYACRTGVTWGGDDETREEDEDHAIISNFSCPNCGAYIEVYHGDVDDETT